MSRRYAGCAMLAMFGATFLAPRHATPAEFAIDADRTVISFELRALGMTQRGAFTGVAGAVALDAAKGGGRIDIAIDARSVEVETVALEKIVRGAAMLDVDTHPQIAYRAERVIFVDGQPARIEGELTLRGLTQEVPLRVTGYECTRLSPSDPERCAILASASFKRSAFGMTRYRLIASDEIELAIHAEGVRVSSERQATLR